MSFPILHPSRSELDDLRRGPLTCAVPLAVDVCDEVAVAVGASVIDGRVEVFPVCPRHALPRWKGGTWRMVPLADLIELRRG